MMLATLLVAAAMPAHAFDRLPAASQAQSLLTSARALAASPSFGVRPATVLAVAAAGAGFDAVFAPAGAAGTVDGGRSGARGTYTVSARTADRVVFSLNVDLGANHIVGTLTLTRSGNNASLIFEGDVTTPSDPSEPAEHIGPTTATGSYTFDAATGTGTIRYNAGGQDRTETFSQTATGMRMTLMGMPHTFTKTR